MKARPSAPWRGILWPIVAAIVVSAVVAVANRATRDRAARNEAAQVMRVLQPLLPAQRYDNRPGEDRIFVSSPDLPGSETGALPVYRARLNGEPVAAVLTVIAAQGYVAPIRLLVSLGTDGAVIAVRAQSHRETPGLGDRIDIAKSDWISVFAGRSLDNPPAADWSVRHDGGGFNALTGATITSRAVVSAVRDAALYFQAHRAEIFSRPAE